MFVFKMAARARMQTRLGESARNSVTFVARCTRNLDNLKSLGHSTVECCDNTCDVHQPFYSTNNKILPSENSDTLTNRVVNFV